MSVFRCKDERLIKGRAHSIVEYDDKGNIVGTYTGYWNPDFRTVTLYPDYRHPAHKAGRVLVKKRVYDGEVRCEIRNSEFGIRNDTSSVSRSEPPSPRGEGIRNATAGLRTLPFVQERMKF